MCRPPIDVTTLKNIHLTPLLRHKSAEMGDRLATIIIGRKEGGCCARFGVSWVPISRKVAYFRAKFHFDPSNRLAPTSQTGQTDRETDNGPIAYGEPFYKRSPKN